MAKRIETNDAQRALGGIIRRAVEDAAGNNDIVSKPEARELPPFVKRAEAEVRADKPKYGRVRTNEVVDRAMSNAMSTWHDYIGPTPRDAKYLAAAEVRAIGAVDPELGDLTKAAYIAAGQKTPAERTAAVRRFLQNTRGVGQLFRRGTRFGETIDAREGQPDRARIPAGVRESFDAFYGAEAADWGSATLKSVRLAGQDLFAVHLSTDGDDGYLELLTPEGLPVVSARLHADDFARFEPYFGLGRYVGNLGHRAVPVTEGYSEDPERLAAGQILSTWRPDAQLLRGTIEHDGTGIVSFETDAQLTPEQHELARFTVEFMYPRSLVHRADRLAPIQLSDNATIAFGEHTHLDGRRYLVADYRDVDNDTRTLYFDRSGNGVLRVAIDQYNG